MLISLSGTMVISCLVNIVQGGGGEVLPRFGMLENSPKTAKCVITFETDCRIFLETYVKTVPDAGGTKFGWKNCNILEHINYD